MTHLYRTECRHCGTELGYLDHCCPNPRCGTVEGMLEANRVQSYATNPQRRLRRIKRWIAASPRSIPAHEKRTPHGSKVRLCRNWHLRTSLANVLFATELEWACKTAMTAVGGEW